MCKSKEVEWPLFDGYVSDLLYPAILGSLIYDLAKFELTKEYLFYFYTAVFYSIDYIYMHYILNKIKSQSRNKKLHMTILDFIVAILFMAIIFSIHLLFKENTNKILQDSISFLIIIFSVLLISISACAYDKNDDASFTIFFWLLIANIFTIFIQQVLISSGYEIKTILNITYPAMIAFYLISVITDCSHDKINNVN